MNKDIINQICQDLYDGVNYPDIDGKVWHGVPNWGKFSDFHEHSFFIWDTIQKVFPIDTPLNIVETGTCTGQSTNLFSAIAFQSGGQFYSFDISDWNRDHILKINQKYGTLNNFNYIVDSSLNAKNYLPSDFKIDILFLDSLHSYEQVKQETLLFEPYLSKTSMILWHDTLWTIDPVLGWIKEYLADKNVTYAKHKDTDKSQCMNCEFYNKPNMGHGRPILQSNGRPTFQSPYDFVELAPEFNKMNANEFPSWSSKSFEQALEDKDSLIFTNLWANCGIGCLIKFP